MRPRRVDGPDGLQEYRVSVRCGHLGSSELGLGRNGGRNGRQNVFDSVSRMFHGVTQIPKEIPVFAQRWSFEEIQEKAKEM